MNRSMAHALVSPFAALALAASILAFSLSLTAQTGEATGPALEVKIADLDLDQPAGIETLYKRLQLAAHKVCAQGNVTGTRIGVREREACVNSAVENAVRQLDRPALTAYHESHAGKADAQRS